jgi:hypothetical protein
VKIKHIEKFALAISLLIFCSLFFIFSSNNLSNNSFASHSNIFSFKSKNGLDYFSLNKIVSLLPGSFLHIHNKPINSWESHEITHTYIPARQKIVVNTPTGIFEGTTRQDIILEENWQSSQGIVSLRNGKETKSIKFSEITSISGKLWLSCSMDTKILNSNEYQVSFYQRTMNDSETFESIEKIKWINPSNEENVTSYDLFTPPIIYIHDGDLTTRLPPKKMEIKELESFGLTLLNVSKAEYPLILKSWVGDTPYFEDLFATRTSVSAKGVRNRVEVGKSYKRNLSRKPGQPSFEICDINDTDKLFVVEHFVVQQYRNPQTGGLRPVGRAMVKDYLLGGNAFEINSLMTKVYAGNFTFVFRASLPGLAPQEFSFESSSADDTFDYGGRRYQISNVNLEDKTILVTKEDPRVAEILSQDFPF